MEEQNPSEGLELARFRSSQAYQDGKRLVQEFETPGACKVITTY